MGMHVLLHTDDNSLVEGAGWDDTLGLMKRYALVACVVFVPWTLVALRSYFVIPDSRAALRFSCVYDSVVKGTAMYESLFVLFTFIGFWDSLFWSFLLLDFLSLSEDTKNVVRAVSRPWRTFLVLIALFFIISTVFSMIGYVVFGSGSFEEDGEGVCASALQCWWHTLYKGLLEGDISAILVGVTYQNGSEYLARTFFDLAFFLLLGVLLMDAITGTVVDTFATLREESTVRLDMQRNECFISGLRRDTLEELGLDFDALVRKEQNLWNYLFVQLYLRKKVVTDMNGLESTLLEKINDKDLSWFPSRTCASIQELRLKKTEDEVDAGSQKNYEELRKEIASLRDSIKTLIEMASRDE